MRDPSLRASTGSRVVRTAAGRAVGVHEFGDPTGRPVLALHGTPSSGAGFAWADEAARTRGLRVVAPDRPGVGRSDPVALSAVAGYASELEALADALQIDRFVVLGYSGGGPFAVAAAHGLGSRVATAFVVASAGEIGTWATLRELARSDRQLTWLAVHAPFVARGMLRIGALGARVVPRVAVRSVATEMPPTDRDVLRQLGPPRVALEQFTTALERRAAGVVLDYALLARPWQVPLDEVAVPVRCWHGTADTLVPYAHSEALCERLPDAQLTAWPGEGHLALISHVGEVLDEIAALPR